MSPYIPRSERLRKQKQMRKKWNSWEWAVAAVLAVALAVLIRLFVFEPFNVSGPSMEDTLHTGDLIIVNKLIYQIREPERGEVIVFHAPQQKDYVKRVIALPGETVEAKNDKVLVNGKELDEPYIKQDVHTLDFDAQKVPPGHVFVMGDNRSNSTDSREIGPIPLNQVIGRADVVYWPFSEWKLLW
jgi:signal peptidase I